MVRKGRKRPPARYVVRHLKQPWHASYIKSHQGNVTNQAQFLAAQDALQRKVAIMRQVSLSGNPYIR